jgi:hypothetical protein
MEPSAGQASSSIYRSIGQRMIHTLGANDTQIQSHTPARIALPEIQLCLIAKTS